MKTKIFFISLGITIGIFLILSLIIFAHTAQSIPSDGSASLGFPLPFYTTGSSCVGGGTCSNFNVYVLLIDIIVFIFCEFVLYYYMKSRERKRKSK